MSPCTEKPIGLIINGLFYSLLLFFSLAIFNKPVLAEPPTPFLTRDQSPFSLIYGLPLASSAQLLQKNQSRWISSLNISNTLNSQSGANDSLLIDVETAQLNLLFDYSFKADWMVRFQLPFIKHSGGVLDSAIDSYHQTFGFPEGLRPGVARNQININYSRDNIEQLNIDSQQQSVGDVSIQLAWQANSTRNRVTSYWLSLKLPTGDERKLTGSGATDIAAWSSSSYRLSETRWLYGQAGLLYMGNSDVLKLIQKNWAVFANAGIKFEPWQNIELKAQLDMHSAFYDTDIEFLGDVIQLTFGGSYIINKSHKLDFAIAEDIKNNASPDVNFNISWWIALGD
ncbi:hypothetical protein MNBD_GAMMA11-1235 [hydrothermal vent metagenome]|uniref:DUF3187 family protein n=1 Tax=hydrothermal vent metagenome TaxID=652676 RepID=A0A3B0XTK3_9ZZZZ